jgi:hypothetical protein
MRMVEIDTHSPARDPAFTFWARAMYDLLGSNMTAILGHDGPDWRTDDAFRKWEKDVLLDGLSKGAIHLLLADELGLRGFLSFTASPSSTEIYVNEIQIRPSARKDGVTFRRLTQRFAARIAALPQASIRTYANRRNMDSQKLIQKAGFSLQSQNERGARFVASKATLLAKFRPSLWKDLISRQTTL